MSEQSSEEARCTDCGHSMEWHIVECGYREFDQKACPCARPAAASEGGDRG